MRGFLIMAGRIIKRKTRNITAVVLAAAFICFAVIPFIREGKSPNVAIISPVIPLYMIKKTSIPLPYSGGAVVVQVYYDFHLQKRDTYIIGIKVSSEAYIIHHSTGEAEKVKDTERYQSILDQFD